MNALSRVRFAMVPDLPAQLFRPESLTALGLPDRVDPAAVITDWSFVPDAELADLELVVTGWGAPRIDPALLARAPRLRGVLHAAGTVRALVDPAVIEAGVTVTSAARANAVPVAEFAASMILLAAKKVFLAHHLYQPGRPVDRAATLATSGGYRQKVGLVGASTIGRMVLARLADTDLDLWVSDPFLSHEEAEALGVTLVGLDELLAGCAVVSLHAPLLDSTRGMLGARELALIADGATLINTARGGLVDHDALVAELVSGRFWAVLDTTDPHEPLEDDSPLFGLPNVFLTPHIAGSQGNELHRLGDHALHNAVRMLAHEPVIDEVTRDLYDRMA